jgi:hypothetical protein
MPRPLPLRLVHRQVQGTERRAAASVRADEPTSLVSLEPPLERQQCHEYAALFLS